MLEASDDYYKINYDRMWNVIRSPKQWIIAAIFLVWAYSAYAIFQASYIQYSPDSFLYKALSQEPLTLHFLVHGIRSPTLPLLLKLFKTEAAFVYFQLGFFYLSWIMLFLVFQKLFKSYLSYLALICFLAPLSLAQIYFSWHKLILTESISLSGAVLLLALLCRFMSLDKITNSTVNCIIVPWVLWQFARDTNAFFSLGIALGFLTLSTIGRISERSSRKWKKGQLIGIIICVFAIFQLYTISQSDRWKFPLVNVIGLRVLPSAEKTKEFVEMGMPMNEKVACFRGKNAVDCNNDWSGFGNWFESGKARSDYQHWLLTHFFDSMLAVLKDWEKVWTTETILYGRSLETPISKYAGKFALPKGKYFLLFIMFSLVSAAFALCVALRHRLKHWLSVLLIFYVANIPVAFVAYHGDALDVDRHTLNVQLNTYLTGWMLIFWNLNFFIDMTCRCARFVWQKTGGRLKS